MSGQGKAIYDPQPTENSTSNEKNYTIAGTIWRIKDKQRTRWPNVTVQLGDSGIWVNTDQQGNYNIKRLAAGVYQLVIRQPTSDATPGEKLADGPVILVPPLPPYDVTIDEGTGQQVYTHVGALWQKINAAGESKPCSDVTVQLGAANQQAQTDAQGCYRIDGVPAGEYPLSVYRRSTASSSLEELAKGPTLTVSANSIVLPMAGSAEARSTTSPADQTRAEQPQNDGSLRKSTKKAGLKK
jgi:hypothetical protein